MLRSVPYFARSVQNDEYCNVANKSFRSKTDECPNMQHCKWVCRVFRMPGIPNVRNENTERSQRFKTTWIEVLRRRNYDWMLTGRKLIRSNALSAKRQQGLIIRDAGTSILPTLRASALLQTINIPEKSWTNWWRKTGRKPDINMPNGRKRSSEGWQSILLIQEINRDMMRRKRNGCMWDSAQVISIQLNIWTKKRCKFLGAPEDITSVWTLNGEKEKRQIDLFRFTHLTFIDEIGLYKDKQIIGIYKRNKKNKSRSSVQSLWIMGTVNNSYLLVFYNNICECAIFLIIAPAQLIQNWNSLEKLIFVNEILQKTPVRKCRTWQNLLFALV